MEYEIQYSRLITADKLPDRFLNAQLKANPDLSKSAMGEVFNLVEILTPWFPTAQIGQTIIQTFFSNYYQGGSTSDLVNFEGALKKVNESLAQITQNGETDWIGNLNSILGVIVENKMHLAQAGRAEAYVFRDGKINHLTEGLVESSTEPHPLSTFSNITSGELKSHDKVLIANPELYKHLSLESLRQIIAMNSPSDAIMQIGKLLKKKRISCVNVLILHLLTSEELAKVAVDANIETVYLDRSFSSIWSNFSRLWHGLLFPLIKFIGKKGKKVTDHSVSFTKNYLVTLKKKRVTAEPLKKRDLYEKEFIDAEHEDTLLKDEEISYSPELDVHYYKEAQKSKNSHRFLSLLINLFNSIWHATQSVFRFMGTLRRNKKTRPYFYIIIAVILLTIIGLFIRANHNSTNNFDLTNAQTILKQAEEDEKNAKNALLSNDTDKAKILFSQAIDEASKIVSFPVVGADAKNVINESYVELDKLTNTTRYSDISPILTASNDISDVFVNSGYAVMTQGQDIYQALISGGKPQKVASLSSNSGDIQFGTFIGDSIYLYTSAQKIYEYIPSSEQVNPVKINGTWETANAITSYVGNIYLLDGVIGQIYKHTSNASGFNAGQSYVTSSSIDLKNSSSITVDGAIYVLNNAGEVIKLQRGRLQSFSLKDIPAPHSKIEKPVKIYTDSDASSIYILDAAQKRIVEFSKNGEFLHQYALPNISEPTDFSVNVKAKKMWVLAGKNLYEIAI